MRQQIIPNCPNDKFRPCRQFKCAWYAQVRGKDPQSDQEIDEYGCSIAWLPILLIEVAQQSRQAGAAIESFRNEMAETGVNATAALVRALTAASGRVELCG